MKILFLHGLESGPHGTKVRHLRARGLDLTAPQLSSHLVSEVMRDGPTPESLRAAMQVSIDEAAAVLGGASFDVVVGSSFGGAIACALAVAGYAGPLVLLAPAARKLLGIDALPMRSGPTVVLHARQDEIIEVTDSVLLATHSQGPVHLWLVDDNHRLERSLDDGTIEGAIAFARSA